MIRSISSLLAAASLAALSMALPESSAQSAVSPTAKQAKLKGVSVGATTRREPMVGRMIVKLRGESLGATAKSNRATRMKQLESTAGAEMAHQRDLAGGAALLSLKAPVPLSEAKAVAARLARDPAVEYAEPDIMMKRMDTTPNEPRFIQWQWNLFSPSSNYTGDITNAQGQVTGQKSSPATGGLNMPPAWDLSQGSSNVVVAVIDTGIVNHTDLNGAANSDTYAPGGRFLAGYDFISTDVGAGTLPANFVANDGNGRDADASDPGDWVTAQNKTDYPALCGDGNAGDSNSSWHGSHMAGVVAATANNATPTTTGGIAGVAWDIRVLPIRALGRCGGALSDISEAIRWASGAESDNGMTWQQNGVSVGTNTSNPARVISLSLGGGATCGPTMQSAVNAAIANGSVVVAATGNESNLSVIAPANCDGVIGVTAHTINGENADYANIGTGTAISAPGGGTPTLLGFGGPTDDINWRGYYIPSAVLFGNTSPTSSDNSNRTGPAYAGFTGTSPATPHVAGVASLIKSIQPTATPAFVKAWLAMSSSVRDHPSGGFCNTYIQECGRGLLDAQKALQAALDAVPAVEISATTRVVAPGGTIAFTGTTTAFPFPLPGKSIQSAIWSASPALAGTLSSTTGSNVTFTAPATITATNRSPTVTLTATDSAGKTSYDAILVYVNRAPTANPVSNQTATVGQTVQFTATGSDPDGDPVSFVASTIPAGATLLPSGQFTWNTTGATPGAHQVVLSATDGISSSAPATVTITLVAAVGAPTITTPPQSVTVSEGQAATFSVSVTGAVPLTYLWRRDGVAISGATSSTYVTPPTTAADNGARFTVTVTNSAGTVTSPVAVLTVVSGGVPPPTGGGGGGGALPFAQLLLLAALLAAARIKRSEKQPQ